MHRIYNFKLFSFLALALLSAISGIAGGLSYLQNRGLTQQEAMDIHDLLKESSKAVSFLNCPIEMIERQWGGIQSVYIGINYLQEFISESQTAKPNYSGIITRCEQQLGTFRHENRRGNIRSRLILQDEYDNLRNALTTDQNGYLIDVVTAAINKKTLCYFNRLSFSAAYGISLGAGLSWMDCYTPLGRRFRLRGISNSVGVGGGFVATLPNLNTPALEPSYEILLYQKQEGSVWQYSHFSSAAAAIGGVGLETDLARKFRDNNDGMAHVYNIKATAGAGFISEYVSNTLFRKDLSPLYYDLSHALNLMAMALSTL